MQPSVALNAQEEADAVTQMAQGQETTRIPGLVDTAVIQKHFGNRYVRYDYQVGKARLQGVIVPKKLADSYQSKSKS
jgi:hypothetical protein